MKKKAFTPGPWVVFEVGACVGVTTNTGDMSDIAHLYDKDGRFLCTDRSREEVLATARLIAQAPALWGLARTVANGGSLEQGRAAQILRAISGEPGKDAWRDEPDARAAGFTGQEQAKEVRGQMLRTDFSQIEARMTAAEAPYIPPDVAAALGATLATFRERGLDHLSTSNMVRDVLGRYCNVID